MYYLTMLLLALLAVLSRSEGASPVFLELNVSTTAVIEEDQNLTIPALSHFIDSQEVLTGAAIRIVTDPEFGAVTMDPATGNITYLSATNDYGSRSFSYQACNSDNNCTEPVNFTVIITSVNDPPVIQTTGGPFTVMEDAVLDIAILVTDIEDRSLVEFGVLLAGNGLAEFNTSSANLSINTATDTLEQTLLITYTPNLNFYGDDVVVVYARDSEGGYAEANISVTVEGVNDRPVFGVVNLTVLEDETLTLRLPQGLEVVDPEENLTASSFSVIRSPATGSLSYDYANTNPPPSFGTLVYTPINSYFTVEGEPETLVIMACDSDVIDQHCVNQTIFIAITAVREGSVSPVVPPVPKFDGLDNSGMEFFIAFFDTVSSPVPTLFVTTRESEPVLFQTTTEGFNFTAAAVSGEMTEVVLPTSTLLTDSNQRNKGVYVKALGGKNISVSAVNVATLQTEAFLALPPASTSGLSTYTYMAVSRSDQGGLFPALSAIAIVAGEDGTQVDITPTQNVDIGGTTVSAGATHRLTLNRLETLLFQHEQDLTGTVVVTDKPVSFTSGHQCGFIRGFLTCDPQIHQVPPVEYWGNRFAVAPLASLTSETVDYRIVSGRECTTVHVSCVSANGSITLSTSYSVNVTEYVDIATNVTDYCWFEAYYPILVTQYMLGEVSTLVPPVNQYSNSYTLGLSISAGQDLVTDVVVLIPAEFYDPDQIYFEGATLRFHGAQFTTIVFEGVVKAYATELRLTANSATLYHADPNAQIGVLVYGRSLQVSYGQQGGLYPQLFVPEDLFMFNITNLDERLVEVTWRKVHETAVGYRVRLLLVDGTIVGEQSVNKTRAFFEELKAYTTHVLEVEALVSSPLKLPLVSSITFRTDPCPNPLDIIFLLDGSSNVGDAEFELMKDFVVNVSRSLPIGENRTRVGVITFGETVQSEIPLDQNFDSSSFQTAVQSLSPVGTAANMLVAFNRVIDAFLTSDFGARPAVANRIVILLAASPADNVAEVAITAKNNWITVHTVGINVTLAEVNSTTDSDETRIDVIDTFEGLSTLVPAYSTTFCSCLCSPPCINGGTCFRSSHCVCPDGWTGVACHTLDPTIFQIQKGSEPSVLPEGQQGTFIVRLNRQIQSDVYLDVMNIDQYTDVLNTRFLFNSTNWNVPQEMAVLGVDDNVDREDVYSSLIRITTTSINPLYTQQDFVLLAVRDTDEPGVIVRFTESYPSPSNIPEGRWRAYDISLPNRPNSTVVVVFFPINTTFISIYPAYMIFEPDAWNSPQILVVTATNDDVNRDSPYFASFGMTLFSLDENFHSAAVPEVNLAIEDNDQGNAVLSGNLVWQKITSARRTTAQFILTLTLSLDHYRGATSMDSITVPGTFYYGDDSSENSLSLEVVEVVNDRGYLIARGVLSHEYPSAISRTGPWRATFEYCCRRVDLSNNKGTRLVLSALVNLNYQASPVLPVLPIVDLQVNQDRNQTFFYSAWSKGNPLVYSLGQPFDYQSSQANHPQGLDIDPVSGKISWNTSLISPGSYSAQLVIQDVFSDVNVTTELFIRVQVAAGNPLRSAPFFTSALEPLPLPIFLLSTNSSFSVEFAAIIEDAFDEDSTILPLTLAPDGAQLVAMEAEWVLAGGIVMDGNSTNATNMTTSNTSLTSPYGGNVTVIRTTFDWVPSASQLGDHFLCAVAVNSHDVYSAPLCAIFRVFGVPVLAPGIDFYGNGVVPQVFSQTYTAGEVSSVAAFPSSATIRVYSMPIIEHMEVSVVGAADGHHEVLSVSNAGAHPLLSLSVWSVPGHANVLVFRGRASAAVYTSALRSISYSNRHSSPSVGVRYIVVSVYDGISTSNLQWGYTELRVRVANQPPTISTSGSANSYQTTFFPRMDPIPVMDPGRSYVRDADSPLLSGATMILGRTADGIDEQLRVTYSTPESLSTPVVAQASEINTAFGRLLNGELVSVISNSIFVNVTPGIVGDVEIVIDIRHSWVGDVKLELEHAGRRELLARSPGGLHCARDDIYRTVFDDQTSCSLHTEQKSSSPGVCRFRTEGVFTPFGSLSGFVGLPIEGEWKLIVTDLVLESDNGRLANWAVVIQPMESHLLLTTPPVVPLLVVGDGNHVLEHHRKWVESTGRITNLAVQVQLAYPYTSELLFTPTLILKHPDGTEVRLSSEADTFCAYGNYTYLVFDDQASVLEKYQYIQACPQEQNGTQNGTTLGNVQSPLLGTAGSISDPLMGMRSVNSSAILDSFNLSFNETASAPSYPVKSSLVDIIAPIEALSLLHGKMAQGEWSLSISSTTTEATLLGWSLRIAREPNIDHSYDTGSQTLSFAGLDSPSNYEAVLKSVVYENRNLEPSIESVRTVEVAVSDGDMLSNTSLPSSLTLILIHHIEIDLDPRNLTNASFPHNMVTFHEMGSPVHVADSENVILSDPSFLSSVYRLTFILYNYSNFDMEGITVDLGMGIGEFVSLNLTNNSISGEYRLVVTAREEVPIQVFEEILRSAEYYNNAEELEGASRVVEVLVEDLLHGSYFVSLVARTEISFTMINDAPVLILNSLLHSDSFSNMVNFFEGQGPVLLADQENLILYDNDNGYLQQVTVTIETAYDGSNEVLSAVTAGSNIGAEYNFANNQLLLFGHDSLMNYRKVIASVTYDNLLSLPGNPDTQPRRVIFVPDDGSAKGLPAIAIVTFGGINDPTVVDLNGPALGGNYSTVFIEEEGPIAAVSPDAFLFDIDNQSLSFIEVTLMNAYDGALEELTVENVSVTMVTSPTLIQQFHILHFSTYDPTTGTLHIDMGGRNTISDYQSILRTLKYNNHADEPTVALRILRIIANDGIVNSSPAYVYIEVEPVNDSPYFQPDALGSFRPQMLEDEDDFVNDGFALTNITRLIGDDDVNSLRGLAVVGVSTQNGSWEYLLDGRTWEIIPSNVSISWALLISNTEGNRIRFIPNLHFNGETSITFVAWDASNTDSMLPAEAVERNATNNTAVDTLLFNLTSLDGEFANAESKSLNDPYSNTTLTVTLQVLPVNDAPILPLTPISLTTILEDDYTSQGDPVSVLLQFTEDVDEMDERGVAIIDADQENGTWEFSENGGMTWQFFASPSSDMALVIASQPADQFRVRFVPDVNFNGVAHFTYLAWDMTDSVLSGTYTVNLTAYDGGMSPYSNQSNTAVLVVQPVNDSPTISGNMTLDSIHEDTSLTVNHGTLVRDIVESGFYMDIDAEPEVGVAVIGADNRFGVWQYTCDSGPQFKWENFIGDFIYNTILPLLPTPEKATLLNDSCRVRFLPEPNFNTEYDYDGYPRPSSDRPYLEVRGWDNTGRTAGLVGSYGIDATYAESSNTNEFSSGIEMVHISITSINDVPQLTLYNATVAEYSTTFTEDLSSVAVVGSGLTVVDVDHARLTEANITIYGSYGTPDSFLLPGNGSTVLQQPVSSMSGNDSAPPDSPARVFNESYLDAYCNGSIERREELLLDVSNTDLAAEIASWCPFSIRIYPSEASGLSTIHKNQFQKVLRTVQYNNSIEEPVEGLRVIEFVLSDGVGISEIVTSTVMVEIVNDAPQLDLNSFTPDLNNYAVFTEGLGPVLLANTTGLSLVDHDNNYLQYARIELINRPDGVHEVLTADTNGTDITATYVNYTLSLTGRNTLEVYKDVLRTVSYENTYVAPGRPNESVRVVHFYVSDGDKESYVAVANVSFVGTNDVPYLDINGEAEGQNNVVEFREEEDPALLVDANLIVRDEDNDTLASITVQIMNIEDPGKEFLAVQNVTLEAEGTQSIPSVVQLRSIFPLVSYNLSTGILIISGLATVDDYEAVLRTVTYENTADEPVLADRTVLFTLNDGDLMSSPVFATVKMIPINDSPRFNNISVIQPTIDEDQVNNPGMTVQEMAFNLIEDDDENAIRGIAIIDVDSSNGRWQYTTNTGADTPTWHLIHSDLDINRAVLLRASLENSVRFVPNEDFHGNTTVMFVAWDASDGLPDGTEKIAISTNDTDPFSTEFRTITVQVLPINDAPVLNRSVEPRMMSILEDSVAEWPTDGDDVSLFITVLIRDVDIYPATDDIGIAITEADSTNGVWQFSVDGGSTWINISDSASESSAVVLTSQPAGANRVRFFPQLNFNGETTFNFKLWDLTSGEASGTIGVDTQTDPVTGPFSVNSTTAHLTVEPVNDSPVLIGNTSLSDIREDLNPGENPGTFVQDILRGVGVYTDVDDNSEMGLAVVEIDLRFGTWEYTCDLGSNSGWLKFIGDDVFGQTAPRTPRAERATLLLATCRIRFNPNSNFNSEYDLSGFPRPPTDTPYIKIRAWDNTGETRGMNFRFGIDTTSSPDDHTNSFSKDIVYAQINVRPINDGPILQLSGSDIVFYEPVPPERTVNPVPNAATGTFLLTDADNSQLLSLTVSFTRYDAGSEYLTLDTSGTFLNYTVSMQTNGEYSILVSSNRSELATIEEYRTVLSSFLYWNEAEEPDPRDRNISVSVTDAGRGGVSVESVEALTVVRIELVNDPPELDLDGTRPDTYTFVTYTEGQPEPALLVNPNNSLIDYDNLVLQRAVITLQEVPDMEAEILSANVSGTSINSTYSHGRLVLTGPASVEEFARVVSSVTYMNTLSDPGNPTDSVRTVMFVVNDGQNDSIPAYSRIYFTTTNNQPFLDVNGNAHGTSFTTTFREEEGPVAVVDRNLVIEDVDNSSLAYIEVTINDAVDGELESLSVSEVEQRVGSAHHYMVWIFRPVWEYNVSTATLRISGLNSTFEYQEVLKTLMYNNLADEPVNTTRNISFSVSDGLLLSEPVYTVLQTVNINDSPYFVEPGLVVNETIREDVTSDNNPGFSLEDIAGNLIMDDDRDALKGIAIVLADNSNGRWEYTTDFESITYTISSDNETTNDTKPAMVGNSTQIEVIGTNESESVTFFAATWVPINGTVSTTEALVLHLNSSFTRVRFVPDRNFAGETSLTFIAWDASVDLEDGSITDATDRSLTDPFSNSSQTFTVIVVMENDAPVAFGRTVNLTTILEDNVQSTGDAVEDLIAGTSDIDQMGPVEGIAITGANEAYGIWQFSINGGTSWTSIVRPSDESAVVLSSNPPGQNRIRFVPIANFNGFSSITFRSWDLSSGHPSGTTHVNVVLADQRTGAFSVNETMATIFVEPVNDSPEFVEELSLTDILEDTSADENNGTRVDDIVDGSFFDIDRDPSLNYQPFSYVGVAVVGVDVRYGTWQWWCPLEAEWNTFIGDVVYGVVIPLHPRVEKATLLLSECRIRFIPGSAHFNTLKYTTGETRPTSDTPSIALRAWDNTGVTTGLSSMYAQDTTEESSTNAFSSGIVNATQEVISVNDLTVITISTTDEGLIFVTEFVEDAPYTRIVDPSALALSDSDHARLESITVALNETLDANSEIIDIIPQTDIPFGIEINSSLVTVTMDGKVYRFQLVYETYAGEDGPATSSLIIMAAPGSPNVEIEGYQALLSQIVYMNTHPEPHNDTRVIVFYVNDSEDVNNLAHALVTVRLRAENHPVLVTGVNDIPFTEGDPSPVPLVSPTLNLTDRDHNQYFFISSATFTFTVLPSSALESLSVNLSVLAPTSSIQQSYNPMEGVLTITGTAPISDYQSLLRTAVYHNTEEEPRPGMQQVRIVVTDANGLHSRMENITIFITVINDQAPVVSAPVEPYTFLEESLFVLLSDITVSDSDSGDFLLQSFTAQILNPFDEEEEELTAQPFGAVSVGFDNFTLTLNGPASISDFQQVLNTVRYSNRAEEPNSDPRMIELLAEDDDFVSDSVTILIDFSLVNDRPKIDLNGPVVPDIDIMVNYIEGSGPQPIVDPLMLTVVDVDHEYLTNVTVELTNPLDAPQEVLQANASGNITVEFDRTTGTLSLQGIASIAEYQSALRSVTYNNLKAMPGFPATDPRIVIFTAYDGDRSSLPATSTVTFESVNDPPSFDLNGDRFGHNFMTLFVEEGTAVSLTDPNATLIDVDNTSLASVSITITNLLDEDFEFLFLAEDFSTNTSSASFSFENSTLLITGLGEVSQFQEAVRSVVYQNLADEPDFTPRVIAFVANDGLLDSLTFNTTVSLQPVNDPPRLQIASELVDFEELPLLDPSQSNDSNMTNASSQQMDIPYSPSSFFTSFVENSDAVRLVNPVAVVVQDDDDSFLVTITVSVDGVLDEGFEAVFFHEDYLSQELSAKLEPYNYRMCPDVGEEFYTSFTVRGRFHLSEVADAVRSLHYCNADEHSLSGLRNATITVEDSSGGQSDPQVVFINVTAVNDAPQLRPDANITEMVSIDEDHNYTLPALSYFFDHEEDLTASAIQIVLQPEMGRAVVDNSSGSIHFISALNDFGTRMFQYRACDSGGRCSIVLNFTVNIQSINDPPFPIPPLELRVTEDVPISVALTKFFGDVEDDLIPNNTYPYVRELTPPTGGNWMAADLTVFTYVPTKDRVEDDQFAFTVCDSRNACINITVRITILPVNDLPTISVSYPSTSPTTFVTQEDMLVALPIRVGDVEDRSFLDVGVVAAGNGQADVNLDSLIAQGVDTNNVFYQTVSFMYQPNRNFFGDDVVVVYAQDSEGGYTEANISVRVEHINDPPVFGIVNLTVLEDTVVTLQLPRDLNVVDPEGPLNAASFSIVSLPAFGNLSYSYVESDPPPAFGTLVYTPVEHNYTTDDTPVTFVIQACDSDSTNPLCTNETISITFEPVNDAPLLPPLTLETYEDRVAEFDLISMISDVEEVTVAPHRVMILHPRPQHGVVTYVNSTGLLMYAPDQNYFGDDVIYYKACDSFNVCRSSGIVNVTILPVNDPPQIEAFTANVTEDEYDLVAIYQHISDVETTQAQLNDHLKLHIVDPVTREYLDRWISPNNAILRVFDAHGIIGYEPTSQFVGIDSFTYAVCDICDSVRNEELGRVVLPPECLRQIEESVNGSAVINGTRITCKEADVRVVVQNVDDVPVVSDISASTPLGETVTLSPFGESRVSFNASTDGYLYINQTVPVFEYDDLQLSVATAMGLDLAELLLHSDTDIDETMLLVLTPPQSGIASVDVSGAYPVLRYKPNNNFRGYDSFEYEVCDRTRGGEAVVHCAKATAYVFVYGIGPSISSVQANSSRSSAGLHRDSKLSADDTIHITFAEATNTPPSDIPMGEEISRSDVDQILQFDPPFILQQITPLGYTGRWVSEQEFELRIVDEGYPQPEIPIGGWGIRVADNPGACGGFDPITRAPVTSNKYCLQNSDSTSFHSTAVSGPITGNFGLKLPEISDVKIILDVPGNRQEQDKIIFANSQIVIYLSEPLSHFQLQDYCQQTPEDLLNPKAFGEGARITLSGCRNLLPSSQDASMVYTDNIALYTATYLSGQRRRREVERTKRQTETAAVTVQPVYSEITFKITELRTSSNSPIVNPGGFTSGIKDNFNYATLADVVSRTSNITAQDYLNYRTTGVDTAATRLQIEHSDLTTPSITNVTVVSDDELFNNGDKLTIVFDRDTDTPIVNAKADIDLIFNFNPSLGNNYGGEWITPSMLQITIITGSDQLIERRNFEVTFTPNYLDENTPLELTDPLFPVEKPWCVGISVCGRSANPLSVGVCDSFGLSCRAFEPWVGITIVTEVAVVVPTNIAAIVAPIVVVFFLIILAIVIGILIYLAYRYYAKKQQRKEALRVVQQWRKDKFAPGKDDKEGPKQWSRPPDVPVMRDNPDPFSTGRDDPQAGPAAGPDPFRNLPEIRPPTALPSENLPPIPPNQFMPRSSPRIHDGVEGLTMPPRPGATPLGLPPLARSPTRQPPRMMLPPLKGNLGGAARRALGSSDSETSGVAMPGALRPARLPSLGSTAQAAPALAPAPFGKQPQVTLEERGKGPSNGKAAIKKVSPEATTEEETQESGSDKGESPKQPSSPISPPTSRPPPMLPGIPRQPPPMGGPRQLPRLPSITPSSETMMSPRRSFADPFAAMPLAKDGGRGERKPSFVRPSSKADAKPTEKKQE